MPYHNAHGRLAPLRRNHVLSNVLAYLMAWLSTFGFVALRRASCNGCRSFPAWVYSSMHDDAYVSNCSSSSLVRTMSRIASPM